MHVILLILKIIGITLLVILGIVLLLALLVLFAPVRYRISAIFPDNNITAKFRWLAGIVSLVIRYPGDEQAYCFRIFGIPFNRVIRRLMKDDRQEPKPGNNKKAGNDKNEPQERVMQDGDSADNDSATENEKYKKEETKKYKAKNGKGKRGKINAGKIRSQIKNVKDNIKRVLSAVRNPDNIAAVRVIKDRFILLLKHLKPKKIYANMVIGTGDPCNTGMLFGGISILMALWPGDYTFVPDFDNKVIEGRVYCKGRIRVSVFLYHIIKLMLDDTVKKAWKHTSKGNSR